MKNGKVLAYIKSHWHAIFLCVAFLGGIFSGIWACSKHHSKCTNADSACVVIQDNKFITKNKR